MSAGATTVEGGDAALPLASRLTLTRWRSAPLYFAQVREDPLLEMEVLRPGAGDTTVVISSGGCTALSLLSMGGRVVAVDSNPVQNHLVELKLAAVVLLPVRDAISFLGGVPAQGGLRLAMYSRLREALTPGARSYWDARPGALRRGVISSGVTERFIRLLVRILKTFVHSPARMGRLLACRTVAEQRELYAREWDGWRWRAFFRLLLSRGALDRAYDSAFVSCELDRSFSEHFRRLAEHGLRDLPVANNYFLHQMLTGAYPVDADGGVPPYLSDQGARTIAASRSALSIVDGTLTEYLQRCPDASVTGVALSNICEWLSSGEIEELFGELARAVAPGALICFRNLVGWTTVPPRWRRVIVENVGYGERLIARDRSLVQRRLVVCRVR